MAHGIEPLFMCLFIHVHLIFGEMSILVLYPLLIWVIFFCGLFFYFFDNTFGVQIFFLKSNLILPFVVCTLGFMAKKPLPNLRSEGSIPLVPSKHFIVLVLTFESLIHLELIFVYYVR